MSRSKMFSGFSWADEAEKEAAAAQTELHEEQRPNSKLNPFGSARPREVVLEEKGVDWRKLDQPPNLREEKQLKVNIPATQTSVKKKTHAIPPRPKSSDIARAQNARKVPGPLSTLDPPNQHKVNFQVFVPPLKYPPRNAMDRGLPRMYYHYGGLKMGWENSQHSRHLRELNLERQRDDLSVEQRSILGNPRTGAHYMMNAENQNIARGHRNKRTMENMEPERGMNFVEKQLMCPPMGIRTRLPLNVTTAKASSPRYQERAVRGTNESDWEKAEDYYGCRNFAKQQSLVQPIQAPAARKYQEQGLKSAVPENNGDNMGAQCGRKRGIDRGNGGQLSMETTGFGGNCNGRAGTLTSGQSNWEGMENKPGHRHPAEQLNDSSGAGRVYYNINVGGRGFGGNCSKREMTSTPETGNNHHQKRRR